jgi:hypothetical protein
MPVVGSGKETYKLTLKTELQRRGLNLESGRQIVWYVPSQSSVVGLRHEVHYWGVWAHTESRNVLRAAVTDFFFNCWCLEITDNCIRHVSGCVHNRVQTFRLGMF